MEGIGLVGPLSVPPVLILAPRLLFSLQAYLVRFGTIVHERFFKPGMLKGFFGSDPFLRIIYEYALKEFEELPIEGSVGRYCLLKELLASLQGCKM
jgi:hypothetical protein